jgi:hypothetical protein
MKKIFVILIILLAVGTLSADPIHLGNFPVGQWLDANYNAVWDFTSNNIRILSLNGTVLYDFSDKTIQNFNVFMEGTEPAISFTCPEAGRSYKFMKPVFNDDLTMQINRPHRPEYLITMKKQ